jgi:hypothetical protein
MTKLLVLYYSTYGHVETMAGAIADGARSIDGVEVTLKRVPETIPPEVAATDRHQRGPRRQSLRCRHHRRCRRLAAAEREGTVARPLSGKHVAGIAARMKK